MERDQVIGIVKPGFMPGHDASWSIFRLKWNPVHVKKMLLSGEATMIRANGKTH
jgi:hypothetical protein